MNKTIIKSNKKSLEFHNGFMELMADENIQLPLREDGDYKNTLTKLFEYYCVRASSFASDNQMNAIHIICNSILKMVSEYNDDAYKTFERLMEYHIFKDNLHIIQDELPVDGYGRTNINLFRLRLVEDNVVYKRKDLFHDPRTSNRDKERSPYRYSLEDRPSLYLSSTVYCCHKELGFDANKKRMIGSLFRINPNTDKKLFIVDIANRPIDFVKNSSKYKKANIGYTDNAYMFVYPFIAACSVIVPNKNSRNITEYKITNILYKWLVNQYNEQLCGIRYFSCYDPSYSITDKEENENFERESRTSYTKYFINYVFPIGSVVDDAGYCCKLKNSILVSNPKFLRDFRTVQKFESDIKNSKTLEKISE